MGGEEHMRLRVRPTFKSHANPARFDEEIQTPGSFKNNLICHRRHSVPRDPRDC